MLYKSLIFLSLIASLTLGIRDGFAGHPKPSVYPVSWELKFEHTKPKRIVVDVPGQGNRAFWYMTYTVMNPTDQEQSFLPQFEMLTRDGRVLRSDNNISPKVHDAIRARERNNDL